MINYIIQIILFQILFLTIYDVFLSKETFFTKNRWYLLSTFILSFLLPLIKIPTLQKAVPIQYTILLPEIVISPQKAIEQTKWYQFINYVDVLFWVGCVIFTIFFFIKLKKILRLLVKNKWIKKENYTLVLLPKEAKAFSFFHFIFLGEEVSRTKRKKIIMHELVHSKQKHSLDLLLFELLKIIMWFNPITYSYQKRITLIHEYISDEVVSKSTPKEQYINNILSDFFQVENISFINQFYKHSLIKKRIIMMTKQKSKEIKQLKYLLLIPLLASMLAYTSCNDSQLELEEQTKQEQKTYFEKSLKNVNKDYEKPETYLDIYFGFTTPDWKEVTYNDLTQNEKEELGDKYSYFKNTKHSILKFYELENKRRVVAFVLKKENTRQETERLEEGDVSFSFIDEVPIYPGCEGTEKQKGDCLSKNIRTFLGKNFNVDLAKKLNLSKGKKRIWISFRIDKKGNIAAIKARAPHPVLREEAIRVASLLPKMTPGRDKGKVVGMKYSVPISFVIK